MKFRPGLAGERRLVEPGFILDDRGAQYKLAVELIDTGSEFRNAYRSATTKWRHEVVKADKGSLSEEKAREVGKWKKWVRDAKKFESWDDRPDDYTNFALLEAALTSGTVVRAWGIPFLDASANGHGERSVEERLDDDPKSELIISRQDLGELVHHGPFEAADLDEEAGHYSLRVSLINAIARWRTEMAQAAESPITAETSENLAVGSSGSEPRGNAATATA